MGFKKGESGNPSGKPKGAKDKVGRKIKESISNFLLKVATESKLEDLYKSLLPEEKARVIISLSKIVIPPTPNISMNIDFEDLSQEQIEQIIEAMPEKKLDKLITRIHQLRR
jgi:hypothetical protein